VQIVANWQARSLIIIDLMSVLRISAPSIEHQVSAMLSILVRYPDEDPDADPDSDFYLMRIRKPIRIGIFI
jgi:hypothetical protein